MKTFLVAVGAAFLVLAVGAGYYFLRPERQEVSIEFSKPGQVLVGQPFTVGVSFSNLTDRVISDAKLSIILPEGVSFLGKPSGQRVLDQLVGDVGPGSVGRREVELIALADSQTLKRIEAKLAYRGASKAQFAVQGGVDVTLGESAITLDFAVPDRIVSGENFTVSVQYENRAPADLKNLRLALDYPPLFQFQRASAVPLQSNNVWNLGTLPRNATGSITVSGNIVGAPGMFFEFKGALSADFLGQQYPVGEQSAKVVVASSPLSLSVRVNDAADYVARAGDRLDYAIAYRNNANMDLENVTLGATLAGEMFDFPSADSDAFLNSLTNTFVWNAANTPALRHLSPGENGSVHLQISLKNEFPIRRVSDKNYTVQVRAQIESPTVPSGSTAAKTLSVAGLETKIAGRLDVDSLGFFRDAKSGIVNAGPFPPRVNQPTEYSIHWVVKNYSTDATNVRLSASLQSNTRVTGKILSTIGAQPIYNPSSGEITWEVGDIPATKGIISQPVEAVFQIENTPAANQVGQRVPLLSQTRIEGIDAFTGGRLGDAAPAVATDLPDDPTVGGGSAGAVIQ